ncbi:hypothetical protein [Pyrobaculum neutrophilum]|uniref:Uncharacterized protein n=1 Tax=Pyrobaculum neutrophilum (strain DSM 2338 / JCM 9278 / NBRC 100436 / V24Sta) TaxID=444157 RepID=B1YBN5_PYRNV|nr:hypothetical protein [Pyrobaculum neutrophilum]ACB40837.1 conserved hypothetical protein [Pyrobaculum neutrophilum V24Sta]
MKRLVAALAISTAAVALLILQLLPWFVHHGEPAAFELLAFSNGSSTPAASPYSQQETSPVPHIIASASSNQTIIYDNASLYNLTAVALSNTSFLNGFGASYYGAFSVAPVPPPWAVALGGAGVVLYGYGLYLSLCRGPLCRWRRFKALRPLSAAAVATSLALLYASPLYLALSIPGAWGIAHYYRARRRLAAWLSSTLT